MESVIIFSQKVMQKNNVTLRKVSTFGVFLVRIFSHIWTEYGEIQSISQYSARMRENTDQKNSKYGHFLRSVSLFEC